MKNVHDDVRLSHTLEHVRARLRPPVVTHVLRVVEGTGVQFVGLVKLTAWRTLCERTERDQRE